MDTETALKVVVKVMDQVRPMRSMAEDINDAYLKLEKMEQLIGDGKIDESVEICKELKAFMEPMKAMPQVLRMYNTINMVQNLLQGKTVSQMELEKILQADASEELDPFSQLVSNFADVLGFDADLALTEVKENDQRIGFQFQFRNVWYTAMSISSIEKINITLNGLEVDNDKIFLIIRGQRLRLIEVPTIHEIFWQYGEMLTVYVDRALYWFGFDKQEHDLDLYIEFRTGVSYGLPENKIRARAKKMMVVK